MRKRKNRLLLMKIISLFSVVRGYNIPVIILAQYLSAIFILAPTDYRTLDIILDWRLFILVVASSISIASGYIINNFYDSEKDLINRPRKSWLDRLIRQKTKLQVYFTLNFIVFFISFLVSWRVALFYSVYIFLIWFYSHKLKKYPIIGNVTAALLTVLPFFGLLVYFYKKDPSGELEVLQTGIIYAHGFFLIILLLLRELIKDLENLVGDFANNYKTIPVIYGETTSKIVITILTFLAFAPVYVLIEIFDVGYMDIYFYACLGALLLIVLALWRAKTQQQYLIIHNTLKFLIVAGVLSIVLIDPAVLWHGKKVLLHNI